MEQKTFQSEYKKILQETNIEDELFYKRERALEKTNPIMQQVTRYLLPIAVFFMFIIMGLTYAAYDFLIFSNMKQPEGVRNFIVDLHLVVIVASISFLGMCALTAAEHYKVSNHTPVFSLPAGFVFVCLFFVGIVWFIACAETKMSAAVQWFPFFMAIVCILVEHEANKYKRSYDAFCQKLAERINAIKDLPFDASEELKGKCSICHEESQYDVCLACEKKFKGERHRVRAQILRAKQNNVPATLTLVEWIELLAIFHWKCAYCHGPYELLEHYVPITQGGGTTAENCVPACFSCNSKKSNKHPEK